MRIQLKKHCIFCFNNLSVALQMSFFHCHTPSLFPSYHYFLEPKIIIMTFVSFHKASVLVEKKVSLPMSCKKTLSATLRQTHTYKSTNLTNKTPVTHFSLETKTFLYLDNNKIKRCMPNSFNGNFNRANFFYNYLGTPQDLTQKPCLSAFLWDITSKGHLIFQQVSLNHPLPSYQFYHNTYLQLCYFMVPETHTE